MSDKVSYVNYPGEGPDLGLFVVLYTGCSPPPFVRNRNNGNVFSLPVTLYTD